MQEDKGMMEDEMAGCHYWLNDMNLSKLWELAMGWTGKSGVLQFMGLQRVGHDWATELNWTFLHPFCSSLFIRALRSLFRYPSIYSDSAVKNLPAVQETQEIRFYLWDRKIPWRRKWQPTLVFLLENPMDRGVWWATAHGVAKSWTWLWDWAHTHTQNTIYLTCSWLFIQL